MAKYLDSTGVQTLWNAVKNEDSRIQSTLSNAIDGLKLEYSDKEIKLLDLQGNTKSTIDVSDFIKDGMLDKVEVMEASTLNPISYKEETYTNGEKFLKFTWNTDGGSKVNVFKMDEITPVYSGSSSITITGDNAIVVKEVKANQTKTAEAIPVAGGPLANLLNNAGITEIDANTDMQSLLFQLLCKEIWPESADFSEGSVSVSFSQPSFSLGSENTTVEVGTEVTVGKATISAASTSATTRGWSGLDYGYSIADDNSKDSSDTFANATVKTAAALSADNYTMSRSFSGFVNSANLSSSATASTDASAVSLDAMDVMVGEGACTVTVSATCPGASVTYNEIPERYACSNLGKTHNAQGEVYLKLDTKAEALKTCGSVSKSRERKLTGARYSYVGAVAGNFQATSAGVRALTKKASTKGATNSVTAGENMTQVIIAFPSSWGKLQQVKDNNSLGAVITDNFVLTDNVMVEGANGYTAAAYKVYVYTSDVKLGAIDYTVSIS